MYTPAQIAIAFYALYGEEDPAFPSTPMAVSLHMVDPLNMAAHRIKLEGGEAILRAASEPDIISIYEMAGAKEAVESMYRQNPELQNIKHQPLAYF